MAQNEVALADLFTAAGSSFAAANAHLAAAGAPALLREASLTLEFQSRLTVNPHGLLLNCPAQPGIQQQAVAGRRGRLTNMTLSINLIAAPATRGSAP